MSAVRPKPTFIGFPSCVEGSNQLKRIVGMDIVVDHTVQDQEFALEVFDIRHCSAGVISCRIQLRSAHVTFRVDCVVVAPIGWPGTVNTRRVNIGMLENPHGRHEAAVRMTDNPDSIAINVGPCSKKSDRIGVILNIDITKSQICGTQESLATPPCAAVSDFDLEVTPIANRPWCTDIIWSVFTGTRSTVKRINYGIRLVGIEVLGLVQDPINIEFAIVRPE